MIYIPSQINPITASHIILLRCIVIPSPYLRLRLPIGLCCVNFFNKSSYHIGQEANLLPPCNVAFPLASKYTFPLRTSSKNQIYFNIHYASGCQMTCFLICSLFTLLVCQLLTRESYPRTTTYFISTVMTIFLFALVWPQWRMPLTCTGQGSATGGTIMICKGHWNCTSTSTFQLTMKHSI